MLTSGIPLRKGAFCLCDDGRSEYCGHQVFACVIETRECEDASFGLVDKFFLAWLSPKNSCAQLDESIYSAPVVSDVRAQLASVSGEDTRTFGSLARLIAASQLFKKTGFFKNTLKLIESVLPRTFFYA